MPSANFLKVYYTFNPCFELTSQYIIPYFSANALARSSETVLSSLRSYLVPTSIFTKVSLDTVSICRIQLPKFLKESGQVRSKARMIPLAPLKYACVMFRNLSWPAVSQICNLIRRSLTRISLSLKSTPIVATQLSLKIPQQYLVMRLVLPTPLSPIITIFARHISCGLDIIFFLFFEDSDQIISKQGLETSEKRQCFGKVQREQVERVSVQRKMIMEGKAGDTMDLALPFLYVLSAL